MTYTLAHLDALRAALASGERRVTFGDRTVEYRSIAELRDTIRTVENALARAERRPRVSQICLVINKGF